MANDFFEYQSRQIPAFDAAVSESKADNNSFSVLVWQYRQDTIVKLYTAHVYATDSDNDYYYELYYVSSGGDDIQTPCISSATSTNYVCPVRYSKTNLNSPDSVRLHPMKSSDFYGVFNGNLKDTNIYYWHNTQDQSANYYWHGYSDEPYVPTETDWKIIDGNLPFKDAFPQMYEIDDAPSALWKIIDGNLPFKSFFPQMHEIDDAPSALWRIIDGNLPFKVTFPKMYKITTGSKLYFGNKLIKKIFFGDTKIKAVYNGDTKIF